MDQLAFWNRELTSTEVNAQFNTLHALSQGPSKVFDLTRWELTLPVNKTNQLNTNHKALEISTGWLNSGFKYVDPTNWTQKYFYLSNDNTMVFEAPWNGARSSTNASPRSELRETTLDGNEHNWLPLGTNTLEATCAVHSAGTNNDRKVIIGQIQTETASDPPVAISYNFPSSKNVTATYKSSPGSSTDNNVLLATNVNVLDQIHYQMQLTDDGASVILYVKTFVNGVLRSAQQRTMVPYASWHTNTFYFKAGCYFPTGNSGSPMAGTAKVVFSSLTATHQP